MKIRLHGIKEECREVAGRLATIIEVLAISAPYPDRGASVLVRVYVEARIALPVHVTSTTEPRRGRQAGIPARRRRGAAARRPADATGPPDGKGQAVIAGSLLAAPQSWWTPLHIFGVVMLVAAAAGVIFLLWAMTHRCRPSSRAARGRR